MQFHHLLKGEQGKKRVGRGGKRGTTSGRGTKGQKSRAGRRIRPAAQDLILRLPKKRGFRNKPKTPSAYPINLETLVQKLKDAKSKVSIIDLEAIKALGFVSKRYNGDIKILGDGEVAEALTIRGLKVSESAKTKIAKAGGKVE